MTASGTLYADENCRDAFEKEINKVFGEGKWRLDGSKFCDTWDLSELPEEMEIPIVDDDDTSKTFDEEIGLLVVKNKFFIDSDDCNRWVEVKPDTCEVIDGRTK